jgi:hypothetical protein
LVLTEVKPAPKSMKSLAAGAGGKGVAAGAKGKAASPATSPSSASPATSKATSKKAAVDLDELDEENEETGEESAADPFESEVADAIVKVAKAKGDIDGMIPVGKLLPLVMREFEGAKKAKAMKLLQSADFHAAQEERWVYDADDKTVTVIE